MLHPFANDDIIHKILKFSFRITNNKQAKIYTIKAKESISKENISTFYKVNLGYQKILICVTKFCEIALNK